MNPQFHDLDFETVPEKAFHGGPVYVEPLATSTLAVASLVFGVLAYVALPLVGAMVAVVLGHVAQGQIRDSGGRIEGRALAKAGLALGYLQLAVVTLALFLLGGWMLWSIAAAFGSEPLPAVPMPAAPAPVAEVVGPPVAGVKMVNEMDRADFRLIADAEIAAKPAEIVAFYNAGRPASNPEFALVTTGSVSYVKDGSKTVFAFGDVEGLKDDSSFEEAYRSRKNQFGEGSSTIPDPEHYHIELRHKGGNRMHIEIAPEMAGIPFFDALKSARDSSGKTPE